MNDFKVYVYFHPVTGRPVYVGKGRRYRWKQHLRRSHNSRLANSIAKYGDHPVIVIRNGLSAQQAIEIEIALIGAIGRAPGGSLFNLTDGGEGASGHVPSVESRDRNRIAHLGKKHTAEAKAKVAAANIDKIVSAETRTKMSIVRKNRTLSQEHRAKISVARKDKKRPPRSTEWRKNLSIALTGKKQSVERRLQNSLSHLGQRNGPEARAKMSVAKNWQDSFGRNEA